MTMLALAANATDETAILVRSDPNGLAFVPGAGLYVADARTGAILHVERGRTRRLTTIGTGGVVAAHRVAGLAAGADGALFVARLGYGRVGAVFSVRRDGVAAALPGLDPRYWRVAVCYAPDERALYTSQFLEGPHGPFDGSVVRVDLASGEVTTAVGGLQQPAGIARVGDAIAVSDARRRAVVVARPGGAAELLAAEGERPDALCACGDDSVLVASYDEVARIGRVRRVWLDGRTCLIARGAWEPRGLAFDGARAYIAVRGLGCVLVVPTRP